MSRTSFHDSRARLAARRCIGILLLALLAAPLLRSQPAPAAETHRSPDGRYTYSVIPGDPMRARIYTLSNGLTVMLSVNALEPRIQTLIATKAGSKNDPADHTGLAHYLEHMLFKGTDRFGTRDFAREKPLLDQIEDLYETYNHTTDQAERRRIYRAIDSVSGVASTFAIANEYDKLVGSIGAVNTNAFTSVEQTVYQNDIPSNQLRKWLAIESERFRNPIFRIFHTELEAVYEEKNIGLDDDNDKVSDRGMAALFHNHPYGTQTTIGTIEHLKNPSLKAIRKYYGTYYVPNNMAIILAGDFDPDLTIAWIDSTFGSMTPKPIPAFTFAPEQTRTAPTVEHVYGPDPESVHIGFRLPGAGTRQAMLLELTDLLFAYKTAGLIDLNLKKRQKVLDAWSSPWIMKDYSTHWFTGLPKEGQSMEEVRKLLLGQIELLKKGKFDEEAMRGVLKNMRVDEIKRNQSNAGRAFTMMDAFTLGVDWNEYTRKLDMMEKVTKQEIVEFARKYYTNDYAVIYKHTGIDTTVVKVEKPPITPVEVNGDAQSEFVRALLATPATKIDATFLDYGKEITTLRLKNGLPIYYLPNNDNQLFTLYYVFDMGSWNDRKLPMAIRYLQYLGTDKYSADQLARKFFNLGCEFDVSVGDEQVYLSLSGLRENFEPALKLFEEMLANVRPDQKALKGMIDQELKVRADAKLDKQAILWRGMLNYAEYGPKNPFTDRLSEKELKSLKADELTRYIRTLSDYSHTVLYYGPTGGDELKGLLDANHRMAASPLAPLPARVYPRKEMKENIVYFVNFDMVQAEILWLNRSQQFDPATVPVASLFNEYYGGSMASVVFQNLRESKALAYSTFARYDIPKKQGEPFYILGYIGTQADKIGEAVPAMNGLLNDMPRTEQAFTAAKEGLRNQMETGRITRADILFDYLTARKRGLDHDIRRDIYGSLEGMTLDDLQRFHDQQYKDRAYAYCVLGSKERIDMKELGKYGRVVELSLKDVFGY